MFRLLQTAFSCKSALFYFMETAKIAALLPNEAIQLLKSHVLYVRAKRLNHEFGAKVRLCQEQENNPEQGGFSRNCSK